MLYCSVFELKCYTWSLRQMFKFCSDIILLVPVFNMTDTYGDCVVIAQN